MIDQPHPALLPTGLHDTLPPDAAHETRAVERLMAECAAQGYERVKPPLVEFEDGLFAGVGAALAQQTFRLMDPASQRMMGVRADMTLQVARIATTRLSNQPRPVRLSYTGEVLRVRGTQLRQERQFRQVGCEIVGAFEPAADAEIVLLAALSLAKLGVERISIDLNIPTLVPAICDALSTSPADREALRAGIDRRDASAIAAVGGKAAALVGDLIAATGPADVAVGRLAAIDLPEAGEPDRRRLLEAVRLIRNAAPDLMLTIDPVERRGFEYQTGLSFTVFARGVRGELGRGGRYRAGTGGNELAGEPSTGFTLFMDSVMRALPPPEPISRVFLPPQCSHADGQRLRDVGWVTIQGFDADADAVREAQRLGCDHLLVDGAVRPVS